MTSDVHLLSYLGMWCVLHWVLIAFVCLFESTSVHLLPTCSCLKGNIFTALSFTCSFETFAGGWILRCSKWSYLSCHRSNVIIYVVVLSSKYVKSIQIDIRLLCFFVIVRKMFYYKLKQKFLFLCKFHSSEFHSETNNVIEFEKCKTHYHYQVIGISTN